MLTDNDDLFGAIAGDRITNAQKVDELIKELTHRRRHYVVLVNKGAMKPTEALSRINIMEAILSDYQQLGGERENSW